MNGSLERIPGGFHNLPLLKQGRNDQYGRITITIGNGLDVLVTKVTGGDYHIDRYSLLDSAEDLAGIETYTGITSLELVLFRFRYPLHNLPALNQCHINLFNKWLTLLCGRQVVTTRKSPSGSWMVI